MGKRNKQELRVEKREGKVRVKVSVKGYKTEGGAPPP
jgi:hypothetical protein